MTIQKITLILVSIIIFSSFYVYRMPTPLTQEEFASKVLQSDKFVVVTFFGAWCPSKDLTVDDMAFAKEDRNKIEFYCVDIIKEPELAKQYEIKGAPSLVYFKRGQVIGKTEGYMRKHEVVLEVRKMFEQHKNLNN